jgi:DHA1 family bicyclomycin/chloramphenicol resistance-like MFS transporter
MNSAPAAPVVRPVPIALLMLVCVTCQMAVTLYLPSMPSMQAWFGTSSAAVQATLAVYLLTFSGAQILAGPISDRIGRRPLIVAGLALFALSALACATASSIEWLIAARALQGVGACCAIILCRAVIRDLVIGREAARANAMLASAVALAPAVSPLIGGQIEAHLDWRWGFHFMTGAAALSLFLVWRYLPETAHGNRGGFLRGYAQVFGVRQFIGCAVGISAGTAMFYVFIGSAPAVFITTAGMPPELFGFITMAWAGSFIVGAQVTARMQHRLGGLRMMIGGAALSALGGLGMVTLVAIQGTPGYVPMALLLMVVGIGNGVNLPNANAMAMNSIDAVVAGTAAAALGIMQFGWGAAATLMAQPSPMGMALVMLAHALLAVAAYTLVARQRARV